MVEMETGPESINVCQLQPQKIIQPSICPTAIIPQIPSAGINPQSAAMQPSMAIPLATAGTTTPTPASTVAPAATNPFIPPHFNQAVINPGIASPNIINPLQPFTVPPFSVPLNPATASVQPNPAMWPNPLMPTTDPAMMMVEPEIRDAAAEWQEYKSQDGKPYYFSTKTKQSVWDKPKALIDLEKALATIRANQDELKKAQPNKNGEVRADDRTNDQVKQIKPAVMQPYPHPFNVPPNIALNPSAQPGIWPSALMGGLPNLDPVRQALLMHIDPTTKLAAAEWSEYRTPDGKPYYFSQKTRQSVWEKPKALIDLDEALAKAQAKQSETKPQVDELDQNGEFRNDGKSENLSKPAAVEETPEEKKVDQVKDKSKPISSTPIAGTPWCVVWTGDNKVFFYNPSTKTSVWERPLDLKNKPEVDKLVKAPPQAEEPPASVQEKRPSEVEPEKTAKKKKKAEEESEKENKKDPTTDMQILAAKQRETIPLEERIQMFRSMLIEKEVSAFSTWEKELQKIVFDPRYLLLTSKERKQVFDEHVKEKAEEVRKERRQRSKQQKDDFRKLLEEANLTYRTSYSEFSQKYSKDERYRNIEKSKDREILFNDFISELRRKEKEEKAAQREKAKQAFLELLKEQTYLDRNSRWSEVKDKLREDPRYKGFDSSSSRENTFKSYVHTLPPSKTIPGDDETKEEDLDEEALKERERLKQKQERIEASLREREKEVARELTTHFRERDKEREHHKHAEAVEHFTALLTDLVRNPDTSWRDAKKLLKKDHRWEMAASIDRDEREKLFNDHIDNLFRKKKEKFRELLDETKEITLTSSWRDIRRYIKDDPRYTKFSSSDRKCEREFRDYMKDKLAQAKNQFRELLKETKVITYKSKKMIEDSEQHLQDILAVLQNDKRYLILDCIEDERRHLLMSYIEELGRKGPPGPPTASDSARRLAK